MSIALDQAIELLEIELEFEDPHPFIQGIGVGRNPRRWWIQQALEAARKAQKVQK